MARQPAKPSWLLWSVSSRVQTTIQLSGSPATDLFLSLASLDSSRYHPSYFSSGSKLMSDANRFTIVCPCCEATLTIDADTGALLSHEEKHKALGSFEDMVKDLDKQKQTREQIFAQEMSSHKDRSRLLEEKFQEAKKKAEKDTKIYRNPLDLD
jgi:hypothetical protein